MAGYRTIDFEKWVHVQIRLSYNTFSTAQPSIACRKQQNIFDTSLQYHWKDNVYDGMGQKVYCNTLSSFR